MAKAEDSKKATRRTADERIAEIDAKIAAHKETIKKLEAKKESILHPKARVSKAAQYKSLINQLKKQGKSPEEIAKAFGLTLE